MRCQCADSGCPIHPGRDCERRSNLGDSKGFTVLYRTDMRDETGTVFCVECAVDALNAGVFAEEDSDAQG